MRKLARCFFAATEMLGAGLVVVAALNASLYGWDRTSTVLVAAGGALWFLAALIRDFLGGGE